MTKRSPWLRGAILVFGIILGGSYVWFGYAGRHLMMLLPSTKRASAIYADDVEPPASRPWDQLTEAKLPQASGLSTQPTQPTFSRETLLPGSKAAIIVPPVQLEGPSTRPAEATRP